MSSSTVTRTALSVVLAVALLAASATMAWAAAFDFQARSTVPAGVTIAGTDLSGMSEAQARSAIESAVSSPVMRPVAVTADGKQFTFDPRGAVTVDVDAMLGEAFAPRRKAALVARLRSDVAGTPLTTEVEPRYSVDATALAEWLSGVAKQVDRRAVNASLTVENSAVRIVPEASGRKTDPDGAAKALAAAFAGQAALADTTRTVVLPVAEVAPKVKASSFGKTIVVDLSERKIRLFNGATLEKTYRCAIGTPDHPTPAGHFEIVQKRYMPTWMNPGSEWAKSMPKSIPPGPTNPLGTRALNLSASGIRFHGTTNIGSVGTAASHGCMRMVRGDIEDLYDRVEVGTQVYIVR